MALQHVCVKCNRAFKDSSGLARHHSSKKDCAVKEDCDCPVCHQTFTRSDNLRRHLSKKHPELGATVQHIVTNHGTMNSANTIHNTTNVHNHITINVPTEFGREDVTQLIEADWNKICGVTAEREIIAALIKFMNCSEERSMNHNVLVPDDDSDNAYVYAQKNWRQRKCDETIRDCISNTSLKAQDALVDKDFQKKNPTPKARIDACLETLEQLAEQADKADSSISDEVEDIKRTIVRFTERHPELLNIAVAQSTNSAASINKFKPSVVFKAYQQDGPRRQELLDALQKGEDIPALDLHKLSKSCV